MKARGRRLETAGFGIWVGGWTYALSPWAGALMGLTFILAGVYMQWRAERRHKAMPPIDYDLGVEGDQWRLFQGELAELVERYGGKPVEARQEEKA